MQKNCAKKVHIFKILDNAKMQITQLAYPPGTQPQPGEGCERPQKKKPGGFIELLLLQKPNPDVRDHPARSTPAERAGGATGAIGGGAGSSGRGRGGGGAGAAGSSGGGEAPDASDRSGDELQPGVLLLAWGGGVRWVSRWLCDLWGGTRWFLWRSCAIPKFE